jgi:hypothetical protein
MRFGPVSAVDERSRHGSKELSTAHLTVRPSNGKDRANTYSHRHPQLSKGGEQGCQHSPRSGMIWYWRHRR